jgi:hypothetical protein
VGKRAEEEKGSVQFLLAGSSRSKEVSAFMRSLNYSRRGEGNHGKRKGKLARNPPYYPSSCP